MAKLNEVRVNGVVPIIPTPFNAQEQIDWPSLQRLVDFACAAGACALCLPAYASEFYKLSERERLRLVAEAVQQTAGRIPVFAQVNWVSVPQAVETARRAQEAGASAIAAAVPRIFAFSEDDLAADFQPAAYGTVSSCRKASAGSARDSAGSGCPSAHAQAGQTSRGSHLVPQRTDSHLA